ncbi:hypothetical protein ACFL41_02125 [Gemmatimonadota bacterium]
MNQANTIEYVEGSASTFYFDQEYGLTDPDYVKSVSDHYPVFAVFKTTGSDDDGP